MTHIVTPTHRTQRKGRHPPWTARRGAEFIPPPAFPSLGAQPQLESSTPSSTCSPWAFIISDIVMSGIVCIIFSCCRKSCSYIVFFLHPLVQSVCQIIRFPGGLSRPLLCAPCSAQPGQISCPSETLPLRLGYPSPCLTSRPHDQERRLRT